MDFWHSVNGLVALEILTADPTATLERLHLSGIPLRNVRVVDELTLQITVQRNYLKQINLILRRRAEKCKIVEKKGIYWSIQSLMKRPVLLTGVLFFLLLTAFIPARIFFFEVEGNSQIPTRQILEYASECGIKFGAERKSVRSEKVKNALLRSIPELEWVGINTSGCVVTISVRERQSVDNTVNDTGVSSIVAVRDGVIRELTVTSGSASCKPGQAVTAGQVLISGYTDCGLSIRAERAKGEILAETNHVLRFVLPENHEQRDGFLSQSKKYSLIIGKKRINFYQDSGNLDTRCVKMYSEKYLTLPGGFQLPVAIVTETCIFYDQCTPTATLEKETDVLSSFAERYLHSHMIAGRILSKEESVTNVDGVTLLEGNYGCLEMIGQEQSEEIIAP